MRQASSRLWAAACGAAIALGASLLMAAGAAATTISVGCDSSELVAAIQAANDETANPGGDTISLQAGCTYSFSSALPTVTSDVLVLGNGARIERASGSPAFSLMGIASSGVLLLSHVTLAEGWGSTSAGANINNSGSTTLVDSTVTNTPPLDQQGPGIRNTGVMAIIDSTVSNQVNRSATGGGVSNSGNLTVTGSTFDRNSSTDLLGGFANGGAISNGGTLRIYDSTFTSNVATTTGGAINNGGDLEVHGSSFVGNNVGHFGGAISNGRDLLVDGSYFEGNHTSISGGAIENGFEAVAQIVNSTFYKNAAAFRGGAIVNDHSVRVESSTFADNTAPESPTVYVTSGGVSFESSILAGSSSPCSGTIFDFGSNVAYPGAGGCPSGFTVGDPKLAAPVLQGGTKTMALGNDSAAIDVAPVAGCVAADQRGFSRPAGPGCDAGAFEDQVPTVPGAPELSSGGNPNQGTFTLVWTGSTDADGPTPSYRVYHRDANDLKLSFFAPAASPTYTFSTPENEGTFRYFVAADEGNHFSSLSAMSAAIVVDRTLPNAPTGSADRPADAAGWYRDTVTVTFSGSSDPALPDGSAGSGIASITAPQTRDTSGVFDVAGKATDAAGNSSTETRVTVRVDAEAPTVAFNSCPADVLLNSTASVTWAASDPSSGLQTPSTGSIPLATATLGSKSVQASATDKVGHAASATCNYRVIFDFDGFLSPIVNAPALQSWRAGDGIPVAFGLAGDKGLGVIATGYPQSSQIDCGTAPGLTSGVATSSSKGLDYKGGRYKYLWSTQAAWAGTCRQLIVKLVDGTYHRANFRFT
jgi:hypothetical protein